MRSLYACVLLLAIVSTTGAQTRRRVPAPSSTAPPPAAAPAQPRPRRVTVKLKSGEPVTGNFIRADADVIHLELAGNQLTLKWDDTVSISTTSQGQAAEAPAPLNNASPSTLSVEAALVYRSGDVRPVARTKFYLLDSHPGDLLIQAGVKETDPRNSSLNLNNRDNMAWRLGLAMTHTSLPSEQAFLEAGLLALAGHIVQVAETDFGGKAQFTSVAPGSYYLMGVVEQQRNMVFWNMGVELKPGQNSITLDQNNAAYAR